MNYGEVKRASLQLAMTDTNAGTPIPMTYNNQADYVLQIPQLVNDCMTYIATTVKKIPKIIPLRTLNREDYGTHWLYKLPGTCWQLMNGGLIWAKDDGCGNTVYSRYHGYKLYGNRELLIPKSAEGLDEMMVEYFRFPKQLCASPADDDELDNTQETQTIIPYYVAAHLVMYDDAFRYSALSNEFESRLGRIREQVHTEYDPIGDVYIGFGSNEV